MWAEINVKINAARGNIDNLNGRRNEFCWKLETLGNDFGAEICGQLMYIEDLDVEKKKLRKGMEV